MRGSLPAIVESFFKEYLQRARAASRHTVVAYRDTLRLFFCFLADKRKRDVSDLETDDLTVNCVLEFLDHLEADRGNSASTRNVRLAALRSFFRHAARRDPVRAEQYHRLLSIPLKRARRAAVVYLEPEEVQVLLNQPDRRSLLGIRDYALMLFLYNTGARIGETLRLRVVDVVLTRPCHARLLGKGDKERFCPLWPETATAIRRLLATHSISAEPDFVFRNRHGHALSHDGAVYIVTKHHARAAERHRSLQRKRVTPHVLRHSCAVAMLQAGMDLTVIRDYLGHASIATTNRYVSTDLNMKRRALDAFWRQAGLSRARAKRWEPTPSLLAFLSSL
jgi:site-specific recombinase XerD